MSSISKKKTILLVDDDATVITALAPQLEESYEVLVARDGLAAAHAYERNVDRIVAMVTDLHMPRLDGRVLAEWVRHIQPRLPVIIISGGIRDREFGEFLRCSSISFLGKPF